MRPLDQPSPGCRSRSRRRAAWNTDDSTDVHRRRGLLEVQERDVETGSADRLIGPPPVTAVSDSSLRTSCHAPQQPDEPTASLSGRATAAQVQGTLEEVVQLGERLAAYDRCDARRPCRALDRCSRRSCSSVVDEHARGRVEGPRSSSVCSKMSVVRLADARSRPRSPRRRTSRPSPSRGYSLPHEFDSSAGAQACPGGRGSTSPIIVRLVLEGAANIRCDEDRPASWALPPGTSTHGGGDPLLELQARSARHAPAAWIGVEPRLRTVGPGREAGRARSPRKCVDVHPVGSAAHADTSRRRRSPW